jgi:hypothetical protein
VKYRVRAPRGDRNSLVQLYSVPSERVSPAALGDTSNLPCIHRAQQAAHKRLALSAIQPGISVKRIAKGPPLRGNTAAMTPRCRASSLQWSFELQGCIKGHATAAFSDME